MGMEHTGSIWEWNTLDPYGNGTHWIHMGMEHTGSIWEWNTLDDALQRLMKPSKEALYYKLFGKLCS